MHDMGHILKRYWGFDAFLPLQREAISSVLSGRDSIVVLPTGGGKSLCFQAPAIVTRGVAVVVSPLISLMKDQVDALTECGVPAARLDSTQSARERDETYTRMNAGELKLLYLAPERLMLDGFLGYLRGIDVSFVAIDEAHCISTWGHDFRPEYRALGRLKEVLPGVALHAYTATATGQVCRDIAEQLRLSDPEVLVGSFDRPNLLYKARRRAGALVPQICEVLDRHPGESGIIYCIRRADVDKLCSDLRARGYRVAPYHAGMGNQDRKASQDAFAGEGVDVIVATVAFGMGIDKSNVRYVVHAAMPKSLEHYQQESGRAGRDGLEAECCLLYSGGDYGVWRSIMQDMESDEAREIALAKLGRMYAYCTGVTCRRKAILDYFGQQFDKPDCGACDVCMGALESMDDPLETAQKIISCVLRLEQRFGADYTAMVLTGSKEQRVLANGHDELSTYGLLREHSKGVVRDWVEQLVAQGLLAKVGEYDVLTVPASGVRLLKGHGRPPRLTKPPARKAASKASLVEARSWEGVDHGLFEVLRDLRARIAAERHAPAYVVFGDAALRDMARRKPTTPEQFLQVHGVGETKREQYADVFLPVIKEYVRSAREA